MLLKGKRGLILGLANDRSIAWGVCKRCSEQGAALAVTYSGESFYKRAKPLVGSLPDSKLYECDVASDESLDKLFKAVAKDFGTLDFLVHAVGFSDKNQLRGRYVETTRDNFNMTMNISVYSFTDVVCRTEKLMPNGGSMLTLTYYGAERVMPHYNVMGVAKAALESSVRYLAEDLGKDRIRVNAISAGPIKTLAASGIGDFRYILKWNEYNSPLRRTIEQDEVGKSAVYLLSDLSSAVTGEVHHVDCGYHIVGMKAEDAPDISTV